MLTLFRFKYRQETIISRKRPLSPSGHGPNWVAGRIDGVILAIIEDHREHQSIERDLGVSDLSYTIRLFIMLTPATHSAEVALRGSVLVLVRYDVCEAIRLEGDTSRKGNLLR
jgi:hypothetical protein